MKASFIMRNTWLKVIQKRKMVTLALSMNIDYKTLQKIRGKCPIDQKLFY